MASLTTEYATQIVQHLKDELPGWSTHINVLRPDAATLYVEQGPYCAVLSNNPRTTSSHGILTRGSFGELARYFDDQGFRATVYVPADDALEAAAAVRRFVEDKLKPVVDTLLERQEQAASEYRDRKEIAADLANALQGTVDAETYSTDVYRHTDTYSFSAEVREAERVNMYISTSPELALKLIETLNSHDQHKRTSK